MAQKFSNVWFATEKQMKNRARFFNFSDRGSLNASFGNIHFIGRKYNLSIKNIKTIDVTYAQVPWTSLIFAIIVVLVFFGLFAWIRGIPESMLILAAIVFIVYFVLGIPFIIFVQKVMLWVEVKYLDDKNVLQYAYFFDGSFLGWQGILGGSLELRKKIRQQVMSIAD